MARSKDPAVTIANLEKNLASAKQAAEASERRYRDEAQAGRNAANKIEELLREIGDEKARIAALETENRLLREMLDRFMSMTVTGDGTDMTITFPKGAT